NGPMASQYSEAVTLTGHIVDSLILTRVMDAVMDNGGNFDVESITIGRHKDETSNARLMIFADSQVRLDYILEILQDLRAGLASGGDVQTEPAPRDGVLHDDFYATTNLATQVRIDGLWVEVSLIEMDVVIVVDRAARTALCVPMNEIKAGDPVVVGHAGIRVI